MFCITKCLFSISQNHDFRMVFAMNSDSGFADMLKRTRGFRSGGKYMIYVCIYIYVCVCVHIYIYTYFETKGPQAFGAKPLIALKAIHCGHSDMWTAQAPRGRFQQALEEIHLSTVPGQIQRLRDLPSSWGIEGAETPTNPK